MSLDAVIRRADGQPLGSVKEVQRKLVDAFPSIQFAIEHGVEYPYHEAHFEGGQLAAQFNLGSGPMVREIQVTLYGRGTPAATPHFAKLTKETGWQVDY
jgi:hypothetical protein